MDAEAWNKKKADLDPADMYGHVMNFPKYLKKGADIGRSATIPQLNAGDISNIVVCGMGGSAIGADLVRSYLADRMTMPMAVCRHYSLPNFVNSSSLVIGSSYSGNTEETLSAVQEAADIGAKVICITTGGKLADMAASGGWTAVKIPPGMSPRAALPYSFAPLLVLMSRLGIVDGCDGDLDKAIDAAEIRVKGYAIDTAGNTAAELAENIHGRIPVIYSGPDYFDAVAVRFKGQICENSKQLAFVNVYPEYNHNELVGWEIFKPFVEKLIVLTLRDTEDHPRVSARMNIVGKLFSDRGVEAVDLNSDGDSRLSRMISLIQLGDFVSVYLALLNGADPTPVKVIDHLKSELAKQ